VELTSIAHLVKFMTFMKNIFTLLGVTLWLVLPGLLKAEENYFGKTESSEASLIGIIYDLKQTQKRESTRVSARNYAGIISEFLEHNWDEHVLNRYFRSARPLYTTQIFIPVISANAAPKAFSVDKIMKPGCWVIHYKGQVRPPSDGRYRFIGYADDMVVVAINGQVLCNGSRPDTRLKTIPPQHQGPAGVVKAGNGNLSFGEWVELAEDEAVDLDILIGERPGGQFAAFVLYEKEGEVYSKDEKGRTRYPVFQLAPNKIPAYSQSKAPPFSTASGSLWKGVQ
jgi:hypothetical protein